MTDQQQAISAVEEVAEWLGGLDTGVNNAGVMLLGPALGTTTDEWDRMIALNVQALLYVTHAALPHLVKAAGSSPRRVADVVNISSTGDARAAARKQVAAIEALLPEDVADSVAYIVTRNRRVAVNEMLVRAGDQTW